MRIQPRQQLLEIWSALAKCAYSNGKWSWAGEYERNSISDAEQLLCLLAPATQIDSFNLDVPDEIVDDVLGALKIFGDSVAIPRLLISVLTEFYQAYTDEDGRPTFAGGSYFLPDDSGQLPRERRELDVVDSFSAAIRLSLAVKGFVKVFRDQIRTSELRAEVDRLDELASHRLSVAMVGLIRGFAVSFFDADSDKGRILREMVNQQRLPDRHVIETLHEELREVRAGLRDITAGSGQATEEDISNRNKLFEIGWSWGIVKGARRMEWAGQFAQPDGVAESAPYLYFTTVALDCIQHLFSERTRILGLLDEEQQRLARLLQFRWDLTQRYWSTIARFGKGRWPLEDIPWRTTDNLQSEYLTLLIASIVVQELNNSPSAESETEAVANVLTELAERARLIRRPVENEEAIRLHDPGYILELLDHGETKPRQYWRMGDFAPQALRLTVQLAQLFQSVEHRQEMLALADQIWEGHLTKRRLPAGPAKGLWDHTRAFYAEAKPDPEALPSWYFTDRVVGCMVAAVRLLNNPPLRSDELSLTARHLLAEAEHLFDQELVNVSAEAGPTMQKALGSVRSMIRRAGLILPEKPGTAMALAITILRDLDALAAARQQAGGAG
jgi:hypothetical protein